MSDARFTFKKFLKNFVFVAEAGDDCDILAVVLPPALLGDFTNPRNNPQHKPVIRAKASRYPTWRKVVNPATDKEEDEFIFVHTGLERVLKVVTKDL